MSETSTVKILFLGDSAQAVRSVRTLESAFGSAGKAGKTLQSAVGVGLVAALAGATKQAVDFDKSMRNVNSIARLSEKQFKTLEDQIRSLSGPTTRKGPTDLANGLYDIVSSGFKAKDAMVVLKQSAVDASAGLTDTATASKAVVAVLNAYGLEAGKAKNVSSLLFKEVQLGVNTFEELAQNIGDTAPQAAALKIPFTEVAAALALITKHGTSMAEASTQVSRILTALIKPTNDLKAEFQHLGFENGQAAVAALGFTGVLQTLSKEAGGSQEKLAAWLGDVRGIRGVLNLTGSNLKEFGGFVDDMSAAFDRGNEHVKAFNEQGKSISAQWDAARSSLEAAAIPIGEVLFPALEKTARAAEDLAGWLTDNEKGIERGFRDAGDAAKDLYEVVGPLAQALAHLSEIKLGNDSLLKLLIEATVLTKVARLAGSLGGKAGVAGEAEKAATKIGLIGGALSKLPASKVIAITIATKFAYDWEKKLFEKYLGADFSGISGKDTYGPGQAPKVPANNVGFRQVLRGTPLAGKGAAFINAGATYGVDPRLLIAIAASETQLGMTGGAGKIHNPFGLGPGMKFDTRQDSIFAAAKTLAGYRDTRGAKTLKDIRNIWAPLGAKNDPNGLNSNWLRNVQTLFRELGATSPYVAASGGAPLGGLPAGAGGVFPVVGASARNILPGSVPGVGTHSRTEGAGPGGYLWKDDDAVDIAVRPHQVIAAVEDGYIGDNLRYGGDGGRYSGWGFTLIGDSGNQYYYKHLKTMLVKAGQRVGRGDPLGTGSTTGHLHFAREGARTAASVLSGIGTGAAAATVAAGGRSSPPKIPGKPGGGVLAGGGSDFSWPSQFLPHGLQEQIARSQAGGGAGLLGLDAKALAILQGLLAKAHGARAVAISDEIQQVQGEIKSINDQNAQAAADRKRKAKELLAKMEQRRRAAVAAAVSAGLPYAIDEGSGFGLQFDPAQTQASLRAYRAQVAAARARLMAGAAGNAAGVGPDAADILIGSAGAVGLRNARARAAINASTGNRMGVGPSPLDLLMGIADARQGRAANLAALAGSRAPGISAGNQILGVLGSLPAGAMSNVTDIFGRVIGKNTAETVRAQTQKLLAILKTETDPAKIEKATEGLKSLASVVTGMFASAQDAAKQKADELVATLKSDFSDALQRELQDALSVFDADTQRLLENSPTVKKLREEQDAHDAQARQDRVDAARKKLAQAQTGSTTNVDATVLAALGKLSRALGIQNAQAPLLGLPVEALTGGPLPTSVNTDDVVAAQKDLDDALYEQQVAADRKKADEETKSIQQSRQAEREALQDAYQAIVRDFERGNITAVQAQEKLVALLHDKVPAMANAGDLLGKAFADAMSAHFKAAGDYAAQVVTAISNQQSPPSYSGPSAPTFNNVPIPAGANVPIQVNVNPSSSYIPAAVFHGAGLGGPQGFAKGTIHVPYTGMALVHAGERIIPANRARAAGGDGGSVEQVLVHLSMDDNLNDLVTAQVAKSSDRIMLSIGTSSDVRRRGRRT